MCLLFSLMVSRIHTVKNVSHLMDLSGKELSHDKLIHESMGKSPSKDHRPGGCGIMTVPHSCMVQKTWQLEALWHSTGSSANNVSPGLDSQASAFWFQKVFMISWPIFRYFMATSQVLASSLTSLTYSPRLGETLTTLISLSLSHKLRGPITLWPYTNSNGCIGWIHLEYHELQTTQRNSFALLFRIV